MLDFNSLIEKAKQTYWQNEYNVQKAYDSMLAKAGIMTADEKAQLLAALDGEEMKRLEAKAAESKKKTTAILLVSLAAIVGIVAYLKLKKK